MLFAQVGGPGTGIGAGPPPELVGFLIAMVVLLLLVVVVSFAISIFFCLNLSRLLRHVHPDNRDIEPGQVWFYLIPFFNIVWIFLMTSRIADSLDKEYEERSWRPDGDFGKQLGMWWGICTVASVVPYIGAIPGIASLVLFIMYWVKTYGWRQRFERRRSRKDYEDDDRRDGDYVDDRNPEKF